MLVVVRRDMLAYKGAMSYGARWMFSWGEKKDEKDNNDNVVRSGSLIVVFVWSARLYNIITSICTCMLMRMHIHTHIST